MRSFGIVTVVAAATVLLGAHGVARADTLLGGGRTGAGGVFWTAPGNSMVYPAKFGTVGGETAAMTPITHDGILTKIRMIVRPNGQDGGSAKIRVFVNGSATPLSCTIGVAGACLVASSVNVTDGDQIAVKVQNDLTTGGSPTGIVFSYGIELQ